MTNRKKLRSEEFRLDANVLASKKTLERYEKGEDVGDKALHDAKLTIEIDEPKLRSVQARLYGWRFVKSTYSKTEGLGAVEFLKREILRLEGQEIDFTKTLSNYKNEEKALQKKIKDLQTKASNDIGYVPGKEIQEAQESLLNLHRAATTASAGLPLTQSQLEKRRKELAALEEKIDYAKKYSDGKAYPSPSAELDVRVQNYMDEHKSADHSAAMKAVLESDPVLAAAYIR